MNIQADTALEPSPGDFTTRVVGGSLHVPPALAALAQAQHLMTAPALAGYLQAFPSGVAVSLG